MTAESYRFVIGIDQGYRFIVRCLSVYAMDALRRYWRICADDASDQSYSSSELAFDIRQHSGKWFLDIHRDKKTRSLPARSISSVYRLLHEEMFAHVRETMSPEFVFVHASCAVIADRLVFFYGPSGSGKSTIALELLNRGYEVYSDDAVILCRDPLRVGCLPRMHLARTGSGSLCIAPLVDRVRDVYLHDHFIAFAPTNTPEPRPISSFAGIDLIEPAYREGSLPSAIEVDQWYLYKSLPLSIYDFGNDMVADYNLLNRLWERGRAFRITLGELGPSVDFLLKTIVER